MHDYTGLSGYDATLIEIILKMLMLFNKNSVDIFYFSLINETVHIIIITYDKRTTATHIAESAFINDLMNHT